MKYHHAPALRMLAFAAVLLSTFGIHRSASAQSAAPQLIPFQGRLTNQSGAAYNSGQFTIIFNLYTQAVGGSTLWTERHEKVGVVNGMVNVFLGSITTFTSVTPAVDFGTVKYLGITVDVDNNPATPDPEMVPRQMIIPAFSAKVAERTRTMDVLDGNGLPVAGQTFGWSSLMSNGNPSTGTIAGAKLTPLSVTAGQIANGTITATQIASNAITTVKIADGQVTAAKLAGAMIGTAQIVDGAVTVSKMAANSVTTGNYVDASINSAKIADTSIATADLGDAIVTQPKIADGAVDLQKLAASVSQMLVPTGTILPYGGPQNGGTLTSPPAGYFFCDGSSKSRVTNAALFAVIGVNFGSPDGSSFNLPDLRGVFLRGRDGGGTASRDPDRAARVALYPGGTAGDLVGSYQLDDLKNHKHALNVSVNLAGSSEAIPMSNTAGLNGVPSPSNSYMAPGGGTIGNETRPKNVNVNYIIKF